MSKTVWLCKNDIAKLINKKAKLEYIKPKKVQFDAGITVEDDLYERITDDDRLANTIFAATGKIYNACVDMIVDQTTMCDALVVNTGLKRQEKNWS